jgi:hypothetical protein
MYVCVCVCVCVCVYIYTVLLPPGVNPIAVDKYIIWAGRYRIGLCDLFYTQQWMHRGQMSLHMTVAKNKLSRYGVTSATCKMYWRQTYWVWSGQLKHFSLRPTIQSACNSFLLHIGCNHMSFPPTSIMLYTPPILALWDLYACCSTSPCCLTYSARFIQRFPSFEWFQFYSRLQFCSVKYSSFHFHLLRLTCR